MLKNIQPTADCDCEYFKSKCAEIHYQTSNFSIFCIFCCMNTSSFADFVKHFHDQHFENFSSSMIDSAEPVATTIYEKNINISNRYNHDPLEFSCKDSGDSTEAMNCVQDELEMIKMKTESQDGTASIAEVEKIYAVNRHEFTDSDDEHLICKIKVEESDLKATNPVKLRKLPNRLTNFECLVKKEQHTAVDSVDSLEELHNSSYHTKSAKDEEKEVDWNETFKPNLLRHNEKRHYKPRSKLNICTYCGRTFRRRYQLDTHLNIHTGSKPHQCEICGRCFRAITTLTRHLNTHEQRLAHNCRFCTKTFTHKAALLSHEVRHTQKRSVPCDECDKYFYTVNQMDTHKRKVHHKANETLPFGCDFCSKRYRSASMLSTHKFKKHYRTAKYSCDRCDKKFIDERQLEMHKLIHVDGLPNLNFEAQ